MLKKFFKILIILFNVNFAVAAEKKANQEKIEINIQFFSKIPIKKKSSKNSNCCIDVPDSPIGFHESHNLIHKKLTLNRIMNIEDLELQIVKFLADENVFVPLNGRLLIFDTQNCAICVIQYKDGKIDLSKNPVITVMQ